MSKKLRGIAVGVCWLYTALVVGFMALRVEVSDLPPFLALVNVFTPFLFVPIPVVFLIVLGLWSESALVAGAIALAIFVGSYGTLFLPRFGGCDCEGEQILRVMTFNLGLHLGRPEALMTLIEDQEADIVAVQEMTSEMAQLFEQELGSTYPYRVSDPVAETTGLFSRYPIIEEEWNEPVGGGRLYLRAVVDWNDQAVTIFVVHPLPPGLEWYRNTAIPIGLHDVGPQGQVEEVTKQAKSEKGLVLIVGDFNMSDQTRGYVT
jgi:vancomycin resistance protein VanJ